MLRNPQNLDAELAKASKKTDMYAFAILLWVLFTEKKPFADADDETALSMQVHGNARPSTKDLQVKSVPPSVVQVKLTLCISSAS